MSALAKQWANNYERQTVREKFVSTFLSLLFFLPHAGCCFVKFYTRKAALDAQNALHNIKTFPGVSNERTRDWFVFLSRENRNTNKLLDSHQRERQKEKERRLNGFLEFGDF